MCSQALGSNGPALSVNTAVGVPDKPTFWQKIGLKARTTQQQGISIFVCCPECAAQAEKSPNQYLVRVITERGGGL